jgi:hypothetical protein
MYCWDIADRDVVEYVVRIVAAGTNFDAAREGECVEIADGVLPAAYDPGEVEQWLASTAHGAGYRIAVPLDIMTHRQDLPIILEALIPEQE